MRQWLKKYKPTSTISNRKAGLLPTRESVIFLIMFLLPNNLNDNTYTIVYIDKIPKRNNSMQEGLLDSEAVVHGWWPLTVPRQLGRTA